MDWSVQDTDRGRQRRSGIGRETRRAALAAVLAGFWRRFQQGAGGCR
jgi:hypothetical protein